MSLSLPVYVILSRVGSTSSSSGVCARPGLCLGVAKPDSEAFFELLVAMADRFGLGVVRCTVAESWVVDAFSSADTESATTAVSEG